MAFSLLLAALPFTLLVMATLAFVLNGTPGATDLSVHQLIDLLLPARSPASQAAVHSIIDDVIRHRGALGISGALAYVWFTARLFGALRSALGRVLDQGTQRGIIAGKLYDFRLVFISTILLAGYLTLSAYVAIGTSHGIGFLVRLGLRDDVMGGLEYLGGRLLAFGLFVILIFLMYRHIPVRDIPPGAALTGAVTAAVMLEVARAVWSRVTFSSFPGGLYAGTLYTVVSIVFWTYYAAIIFLLGGEVARVHEIRRGVMRDGPD